MTATRFCLILLSLFLATLSAETLLEDRFTAATMPNRDLAPGRGTWKIQGGVATCTQDDALYAKNKDHGPILWYDVAFTDGTVRFAFKPEKAKTFVFTLNNGKGHVFRFVQTEAGLSVRAWPEQGKEAKAAGLINPNQNSTGLSEGQWTQAELTFQGNQCTVAVGGFKQSFTNPAIGYPKTKLGLGFSFGTVSVRDVSVETRS